jgi:hypothetical protein
LRVAHIAGEYPTNASAAGQLISLAWIFLPDSSNSFARHLAFFAALSFA